MAFYIGNHQTVEWACGHEQIKMLKVSATAMLMVMPSDNAALNSYKHVVQEPLCTFMIPHCNLQM